MTDRRANAHANRYHWLVVQDGQLPLQPDGIFAPHVEHRCTVTLVWPEGRRPTPSNTLLIDPCFSDAGYALAKARLAERGIALTDVGRIFVTHLHADHMLHTPYNVEPPRFRAFRPGQQGDPLGDVRVEDCSGHHPVLLVPVFEDTTGQVVWVASDAALGEDWLRAWKYYWPNEYTVDGIVQTWRSLATIIAGADLIIPGHAAPIIVSADLVENMLAAFPQAEHADRCPDVADMLRARLAELREVND